MRSRCIRVSEEEYALIIVGGRWILKNGIDKVRAELEPTAIRNGIDFDQIFVRFGYGSIVELGTLCILKIYDEIEDRKAREQEENGLGELFG